MNKISVTFSVYMKSILESKNLFSKEKLSELIKIGLSDIEDKSFIVNNDDLFYTLRTLSDYWNHPDYTYVTEEIDLDNYTYLLIRTFIKEQKSEYNNIISIEKLGLYSLVFGMILAFKEN